jgi:ABC-type nitrate/sulfonate/bicarbonate transport system substrate-binding protein
MSADAQFCGEIKMQSNFLSGSNATRNKAAVSFAKKFSVLGMVSLMALAGSATVASAKTTKAVTRPKTDLTVAISTPSTLYSVLYVAQQQGYFSHENVKVNILVDGSDGATDLVAGRADVELAGTTEGFSALASGEPMKILYANVVGDISGAVLVNASSSYKTLDSLAGQSVGVIGVGTSAYGSAEFLSAQLVKAGLAPLKVIGLTSLGAVQSELASGAIAATVGPLDFFPTQLANKSVRVLVNPTTATDAALLGGAIAPSSAVVLSKTATSKNTALVSFLAGMIQAAKYVHSATPAKIASILKTNAAFAPFTKADLTQTETQDKPYLSSIDGQITSTVWKQSLATFTAWNLPVNLSDPMFSYKSIIDMGPLGAAIKLVNS